MSPLLTYSILCFRLHGNCSGVPGGERRAVWDKCVVTQCQDGQGSGAAQSSELAAKLHPWGAPPAPQAAQSQGGAQTCPKPGAPVLLWAQAACPCPRTGAHSSSAGGRWGHRPRVWLLIALIKTANLHLFLLKPSRSGNQLWCSKKNSWVCGTKHSCHEEAAWAEFKAASWTKVICYGYSSAELFLQLSPKASSQSVLPKVAEFKSIQCAACYCHHQRLGEFEAYEDESDFQR